jgi:transposase
VVVGIEATGAMQWSLELLEELGIVCRVGHPAKIRAAETRKQKHDRRDARLMLDLLTRCEISAHRAPNECFDTLPRTRESQEPIGYHRGMKPGRSSGFC